MIIKLCDVCSTNECRYIGLTPIELLPKHIPANQWIKYTKSLKEKVKRYKYGQNNYYIDGLYMWTKATGKDGRRLQKKEINFLNNDKYNDWVKYEKVPDHIPVEQHFNYYYLMWKKENETLCKM